MTPIETLNISIFNNLYKMTDGSSIAKANLNILKYCRNFYVQWERRLTIYV